MFKTERGTESSLLEKPRLRCGLRLWPFFRRVSCAKHRENKVVDSCDLFSNDASRLLPNLGEAALYVRCPLCNLSSWRFWRIRQVPFSVDPLRNRVDCALAGGYAFQVRDTVEIHSNTVRVAAQVALAYPPRTTARQ